MASQSIFSVCLYGVCGIRVNTDIQNSTKGLHLHSQDWGASKILDVKAQNIIRLKYRMSIILNKHNRSVLFALKHISVSKTEYPQYFFSMSSNKKRLLDNVCGLNKSWCQDILTADVAVSSWRKCSTGFNHAVFINRIQSEREGYYAVLHTNVRFKWVDGNAPVQRISSGCVGKSPGRLWLESI